MYSRVPQLKVSVIAMISGAVIVAVADRLAYGVCTAIATVHYRSPWADTLHFGRPSIHSTEKSDWTV